MAPVLSLGLLSAGCSAAAAPEEQWEQAYRREFGRYQFAAICHEQGFDGSRLAALRAEAARKGYSASVRWIERELTDLRSKELIVCASDGPGKGR
ncbi:MAG TPA: hypothetical protein VKI45_09775 [Allosphingosinicella sp.]|nr:hypothetical protein [Allosphingosinicella sp.]